MYWPFFSHDALSTLVTYFESRGHHARGEQTLFEQLQRPANTQQKLWLTRSFILGRLYNSLVTLSRKDMVAQDKLLRLGAGIMSMKVDLDRQKDLLRERALRMQNDFFRAVKQGDSVVAEQIREELRGN